MRQRLQKILSKRWPALLWTILILILISIPGEFLPKDEKTFVPNLDKLIHATLFGSFVFLWSIYYATKKESNIHPGNRFIWILIIACIYGVATELIQKYLIPNRDYDIFDIVADSIGAILGFIIVRLTVSWFKTE